MKTFTDNSNNSKQLALPNNMKNKIYASIIWIFPLGAIWVHHFASLIFFIIILLGFTQFKGMSKFNRNEIALITLFGLFFILMFPGALLYGWSYEQTRIVGVELYFLLFIPVYLFIKQHMNDYSMYLKSLTITGIILSVVVTYEVLFLHQSLRGWGEYGGQMISMVAIFCFSAAYLTLKKHWKNHKNWAFIALFSLIVSFTLVLYSGVRGSILAILTISSVILFFDIKKITTKLLFAFVIVSLLLVGYASFSSMKAKIDFVPVAIHNYMNDGIDSKNSSTGQRLEMAKSVYHIAKDAPVFGIGRRNYKKEVVKLKSDGVVSEVLIGTNHPHSIFYTTLYGKGLFGLLVLFLIFGLLLKMAYQHKNSSAGVFLGLFTLSFIITGMFDTYPLYRGVSLAFFIITIAASVATITNQQKAVLKI